jgi:hypothetical protein
MLNPAYHRSAICRVLIFSTCSTRVAVRGLDGDSRGYRENPWRESAANVVLMQARPCSEERLLERILRIVAFGASRQEERHQARFEPLHNQFKSNERARASVPRELLV